MTPEVVVIIVSYRSAALTIESLASLQAERESARISIRAIVVDNASGDAAAIEHALLERGWQAWVELIVTPRNGGFAYGNNRGIERAYARQAPSYIHLLNPDTQIRPGAITTLVQFLESHPRVGIVGSSFENADGSEWPIAFRFPGLVSELLQGLQLGLISRLLHRWEVPQQMDGSKQQPIDWISGASMMIRPAVFAAIGGLDESYFLYFEETDFCRRARQAGFTTWYVPASRVMHISGGVTKVTERTQRPRRLPTYWFESRRRYFAVSFGVARAMLIDSIALVANALGVMKRALLGRSDAGVPYFTRDLARNSILWPRNRTLSPPCCPAPQMHDVIPQG